MSGRNPVRLVCFDLGGVLVRICRSWKEACLAAGFDLRGDPEHANRLRHDAHELSRLFVSGCIDCKTWADRMHKQIGGAYTSDEIIAIHDAILLGEYEGVCEVIDRIHQAGLQSAALSNTNERHWATMMKTYPSLRRLHFPHASHLLGMQKPDAAIYREFQKRVGRNPHEILFFDDMPENIAAAKSTGWDAELIDPFSRTDQQLEAALRQRELL